MKFVLGKALGPPWEEVLYPAKRVFRLRPVANGEKIGELRPQHTWVIGSQPFSLFDERTGEAGSLGTRLLENRRDDGAPRRT